MVRAIVSAVLLVLLAVLVVFNLQFTASVSLFGARFDQVPVVAIALLGFAMGVIYSLFLYVSHSLRTNRRKGLEKKHQDLAERERRLEAQTSEPLNAETSEGADSADKTQSTLPGG
jgi:uncharacterized integral membrane protein